MYKRKWEKKEYKEKKERKKWKQCLYDVLYFERLISGCGHMVFQDGRAVERQSVGAERVEPCAQQVSMTVEELQDATDIFTERQRSVWDSGHLLCPADMSKNDFIL